MMSKKVFALVIGLALLFSMVHVGMSADAPVPAPMNPKVKAMLDTTRGEIKKVPAEAAKAAIDSKEKAVFLDVRDPAEFAAGHYPGVMNISRGTLEFTVFNAIPDQNAKIYVYCRTGGRGALATKT